MMNRFFTFLLINLSILTNSICQSFSWEKLNSIKSSNIEDIAIDKDKFFYASIKERSIILRSGDFGNTWTNANDTKQKFDPLNFKKYFTNLNGTDFCAMCASTVAACMYFRNINYEFTLDSAFSSTINPNEFHCDESSNCYKQDYKSIYKINSKNDFDPSDPIFQTNDIIIKSQYYNKINNFIITKSNNDTIRVYKLNTETRTKELYSKLYFKYPINKITSFIDSLGNIYFAANDEFRYASNENPFEFNNIKIDSNRAIYNFFKFVKGIDKNLYLVTDQGVYLQTEIKYKWNFVFNLRNFPNGIVSKAIIYDTTFASLLVEDDCFTKSAYVFHSKSSAWEKINPLMEYFETFASLSIDSFENIVSYTNCAFKYSTDYGQNWTNIQSDNLGEIQFLQHSYSGAIYAIIDNSLYYKKNFQDSWQQEYDFKLIEKNLTITDFRFIKKHMFLKGSKRIIENGNILDIQILLHSEDYGKNWNSIGLNDNTSVANISITKSLYWLNLKFTEITVSYDLGQSWIQSSLWKDFLLVNQVFELDTNVFIVSGIYKGIFGTYKINKDLQVEILHPALSNKLNSVSFSIGVIFGVISSSDGYNFFYSLDTGKTLIIDQSYTFESNMDLVYVSTPINSKTKIYIIDLFSGLYSLNLNDLEIPNSVSTYSKSNCYNLKYFQNHFIVENDDFEYVQFLITDISGKSIKFGILSKNEKLIDIDQLQSGLYILNVKARGCNSSIKFYKK